jgi:hypothetical protein
MAQSLRDVVRQRASGRCEYCRLPDVADEWPFHVDHVVPRQHDGGNLENLCWACSRCNLLKGTNLSSLDPPTTTPISLYHPRRDRWDDHFRFEGARIVGITPNGRATVRLLAMNASSRIDLRGELIALGEL